MLLLPAGPLPGIGAGCSNSGGTAGFGSGSLFLGVDADFMTGLGAAVVFAVVRTEDNGLRVGRADPGVRVTLMRDAAAFDGWISVGMTRVRTTVVVIELKISVVVVILVDPSGTSLGACVRLASAAVPRIVREPMIVDTNVLGGITVVRTDVIVSGLSLV